MTKQQIETLFIKEVNKKDFGKIHGIKRSKVYEYRKRAPTFATKLKVLYSIGAIEISEKN